LVPLAISGVPGFSGFFSKDLILMAAYESGHVVLFWLALIAAIMTAFYMFRLFFVTFTGEPRHHTHAHESPLNMTFPMSVLAAFALFSGYAEFGGFTEWLGGHGAIAHEIHGPGWIMGLSIAAALFGIALAWLVYGRGAKVRQVEPKGLHKLLYNKYYVDEIYEAGVIRPYTIFGYILKFFDHFIIGGLVKLTVVISQAIGRLGSRLQNGQVQAYGLIVVVGLVLILVSLTAGRLLG